MNIVWLIIAILAVMVTAIIIPCMILSGKCSRQEERREDNGETETT